MQSAGLCEKAPALCKRKGFEMDSITTTLARTKLAIVGDMWSFQDWLIDELPVSLSGSDALDITKRFGADFLRWVIYRKTESEDTPLAHMTAQEFGGQIFAQVMLDQPSDSIAVAAYDELIAAIRAKYLAAPVAEAKEHPAPASSERGNPGRQAHARARARLRTGENEDAVRADWRKDYEDETGMAPADTTSGERELWRNVKRGNK